MAVNVNVTKKIKDEARRVKTTILGGRKPSMKFPMRSLSNVRYNAKAGFLEMKRGKKEQQNRNIVTCGNLLPSLSLNQFREM